MGLLNSNDGITASGHKTGQHSFVLFGSNINIHVQDSVSRLVAYLNKIALVEKCGLRAADEEFGKLWLLNKIVWSLQNRLYAYR